MTGNGSDRDVAIIAGTSEVKPTNLTFMAGDPTDETGDTTLTRSSS